MENERWLIEENADGTLRRIAAKDDPYAMNWIEGDSAWGTIRMVDGLQVETRRRLTKRNTLEETYHFTNGTRFDLFCPVGTVSIAVPFNDSYHDAALCLKQRCHTHLWCGGGQSWIMALRMGGEAPHLGLMLTAGSLDSYSVERRLDGECVSNDRGDFWLHPSSFRLLPGESFTIRWELFWHDGKQDFFRQLAAYPNAMVIESERYVLFQNEPACLRCNGAEQAIDTGSTGEQIISLHCGERCTRAAFRILPPPQELLRQRVRFIAAHQQELHHGSALDGAYLIYDNSTGERYYSHVNDHNGGRERIGMGALAALYLRGEKDEAVNASLMRYAEYVLRELYDEQTGEVFNDVGRDNSFKRLYNAPWFSVFFLEMYHLTSEVRWLERAAKVMLRFYENGGVTFYPIGIPMTELCSLMQKAGMLKAEATLRTLFIAHARQIAQTGLNYPRSEVDYEQSIVAPAVTILLMGYELGGGDSLLSAAKEQLSVLTLFGGSQPDYHMNEVAIRHWDGYWFGKERMLGDTFPHYWSSLSGLVYAQYGRITGDADYLAKAERALRGPLSLFFDDGSASCAMVYPRAVNGRKAHFFDPWANDQDWGLYFYISHMLGLLN